MTNITKLESLKAIDVEALEQKINTIKNESSAFLWTYKKIEYLENMDLLAKYLLDLDISKQLVELRIFNQNEEYYFWRTGDEIFNFRHRVDDENDTHKDKTLKILTTVLKEVDLITRNYYSEDYSGFIDSRFVKINNSKTN